MTNTIPDDDAAPTAAEPMTLEDAQLWLDAWVLDLQAFAAAQTAEAATGEPQVRP